MTVYSLLASAFEKCKKIFTRYAHLEKRVTGLEEEISNRSEKSCPSCGSLKFFVSESLPSYGWATGTNDKKLIDSYTHVNKCSDCGYERVYRERL